MYFVMVETCQIFYSTIIIAKRDFMASKGPLLNEKQKDVICDGTLIHNKKSPVDAHFFFTSCAVFSIGLSLYSIVRIDS